MVSNSQMTDAQKLATEFEKENPGIKLKFITLSENQARAKITMSTAMGGSEFDVVMISNYETPQWAENGWLVNLSELREEHTRLRRERLHSVAAGVVVLRGQRCTRCRSTASRRS